MIPKYMYHYTDVETLKKIIETKKIRFTRLDLLNDPYEGLHKIGGVESYESEMRQLVYCSCWTNLERESVNLWSIYSDMEGVRIKMKSTLFSERLVLREIRNGFIPIGAINPIKVNFLKDNEDMEVKQIYGPFKIQYVNEINETYEDVVSESIANEGTDDEFTMNNVSLEDIGMKKVRHWEYENEWRYKIAPVKEVHGSNSAFSKEVFEVLITPEYIDVPYKTDIEEILVGPKVSEETENDLRIFLKNMGLEISVRRSDIKINYKKMQK